MDRLANVDGIASISTARQTSPIRSPAWVPTNSAAEHAVIGLVEQELGEPFVAPVGDRAARCRPREYTALPYLMPCALHCSSVTPATRDLGDRIGDRRDLSAPRNAVS